jgi:broad specificity phosphatase PhoE
MATAKVLNVPVHSTTLLRELDFGEWEGQKWSQIQAANPEDFSRLMSSDPGFAPPAGETIDHLNNRLDQAIGEYDLGSSQRTIAVVAHDGILRSMIAAILGWPATNMVNMILFNGSVSEIVTQAKIPKLAQLNFYDHMTPSYEESKLN